MLATALPITLATCAVSLAGQTHDPSKSGSSIPTAASAQAATLTPEFQTITPTPITGIIKNPGIGYQTFYKSSTSDTQLPSSTMYIRLNWSQVESAPGVFNFEAIDHALSSAKSAGQRLAFRIMGYEEGNFGPAGLKNAGFPGFTFSFERFSSVWFPDLTQNVVQQDLAALVSALGQRYGNNPAIDSVDIGFVGDWGEFHFWHTSPMPPYPSTSALNKLTDDFLANFTVPIVIGGDVRAGDQGAFNYAVQNKAGWRVDCWGNYAAGWNHMRDAYPAILEDAPNAWQNAPVILEPCGVMSNWVASNYPWKEALLWAIDNHASQFSNKSSPIPSVMLPYVREMLTKIGYRIVLTQAQMPISVTHPSFSLCLNWSNVGNAPMYFERHLLVKVGSLVTDTGITMKGFLPGNRTDNPTISVEGLASGTYPVQIGLAAPGRLVPDITIAIAGEGPWYTLGNLVVGNAAARAR
ncbi:DUF4832 domain-containing protein [Bradyrhizobium sp. GCM10027634]|uniref:DUF4832 domain-containing protein n=1 Tax=unclassified Bradyrhizobium TaxID=2631580 RepID=UPI00263ADCF8|nr:DUF4832 domain-containing protein [Bradyrhizobium sp. WYCCWR 12677]MDN5001385.1 DUF4832 domain-containing protein [Bradyrhizobium sp. WYCCWR 12677]